MPWKASFRNAAAAFVKSLPWSAACHRQQAFRHAPPWLPNLNVLRSACKALEQSRSKLSTQLERLEQVREELASAGSNLETP